MIYVIAREGLFENVKALAHILFKSIHCIRML